MFSIHDQAVSCCAGCSGGRGCTGSFPEGSSGPGTRVPGLGSGQPAGAHRQGQPRHTSCPAGPFFRSPGPGSHGRSFLCLWAPPGAFQSPGGLKRSQPRKIKGLALMTGVRVTMLDRFSAALDLAAREAPSSATGPLWGAHESSAQNWDGTGMGVCWRGVGGNATDSPQLDLRAQNCMQPCAL